MKHGTNTFYMLCFYIFVQCIFIYFLLYYFNNWFLIGICIVYGSQMWAPVWKEVSLWGPNKALRFLSLYWPDVCNTALPVRAGSVCCAGTSLIWRCCRTTAGPTGDCVWALLTKWWAFFLCGACLGTSAIFHFNMCVCVHTWLCMPSSLFEHVYEGLVLFTVSASSTYWPWPYFNGNDLIFRSRK